eukprot:CAMPEP_0196752036 /NCGR_PEP_ID=MMETSP1091-20130531/85787_1 /TAXON_ID=302021 /ORGANISM="Rhodomonas sp., Strain CCMP768" /LENGTH=43 /DNA_ID= /DNA_START= /DNA_END= /DNA_ORIENTATION=
MKRGDPKATTAGKKTLGKKSDAPEPVVERKVEKRHEEPESRWT